MPPDTPEPPRQPDAPLDIWAAFLNPGPQSAHPIEGGAPGIIGFAFDALAGDYAKLFLFFQVREKVLTRAVLAGSYAETVAIQRQMGQIGPDQRIYHMDYYDAQVHQTLGFSKTPYTQDQVRDMAVQRLA